MDVVYERYGRTHPASRSFSRWCRILFRTLPASTLSLVSFLRSRWLRLCERSRHPWTSGWLRQYTDKPGRVYRWYRLRKEVLELVPLQFAERALEQRRAGPVGILLLLRKVLLEGRTKFAQLREVLLESLMLPRCSPIADGPRELSGR